MAKKETIKKLDYHLHIWIPPRYKNRVKLGSSWRYYSECEVCGKLICNLRLDIGEFV